MKNKIIWLVIILALIVIGISVFRNKPEKSGEVIKIGVIAGTTGQYAPAGEGYVKGFRLALEQWNQSHSPKFDAIFEDDGFDAVKGLSAYQKLSSVDKVAAYAVVSSFTIDAIYDLVHKENKPVALGFEQSKPAENDNIFQVLPAAKPVQFALGQKVKELGYQKPVAAVSNTSSVYQNFFDGFNAGFGSDVKKFDVGSDITGIRSRALEIISANPDVVAFFMAPKDGASLVKEILKITSSKNRPFFVFDQDVQSGSTDYKTVLGSDISKIDGSLVSMSKNDLTADFKISFTKKYGIEAPFGSDIGYNAFWLLATTYDKDNQTWINNMNKAHFTGADGEVSFDATGLRVPNVFFGTIANGQVKTN